MSKDFCWRPMKSNIKHLLKPNDLLIKTLMQYLVFMHTIMHRKIEQNASSHKNLIYIEKF